MTIFYDFNVTLDNEVINLLSEFDYSGACIFFDVKDYDNRINQFHTLCENTSLNLYNGVRISNMNASQIHANVQKYRSKADFIMVDGGDASINRVICENPSIDIINEPYNNNKNSGINHILAKLLVENNITVNIDLHNVLNTSGYYRVRLFNQINQLFKLEDKYNFRIIISSGSKSFYDVRSPDEIIRLSQLLSIDPDRAKKYISTNPSRLIENTHKRKDSVVDGVRIIKDNL
ncbi:MAG: hypothetical protein LUG89_01040 [Methanosphaera sp.]|nr:hypothetical protein [Methanosphaera sp.]